MWKCCTEKSDKQKRLALQFYLEGLGFRAIGRVLNISYGTVLQWVKKWGELCKLPTNEPPPIEVVELDEIHIYVQHKKTTVGCGLLWVDLEKSLPILFVEGEIP